MGHLVVSETCRWQGSLEGGREITQVPTGSLSLCSRNQDVGYIEKRGAPQASRCGGHSLQDRTLGGLWQPCVGRASGQGMSGRFNRIGVKDCKGPGESGRGVCGRACPPGNGRQQQGFGR